MHDAKKKNIQQNEKSRTPVDIYSQAFVAFVRTHAQHTCTTYTFYFGSDMKNGDTKGENGGSHSAYSQRPRA